MHDQPGPFFVIGTTALLAASFLTAILKIATIRRHVDEEKIRKEPLIAPVIGSLIPPERLLTQQGLRNLKTAKIALVVWAVTIAVVITRLQFVQK